MISITKYSKLNEGMFANLGSAIKSGANTVKSNFGSTNTGDMINSAHNKISSGTSNLFGSISGKVGAAKQSIGSSAGNFMSNAGKSLSKFVKTQTAPGINANKSVNAVSKQTQ